MEQIPLLPEVKIIGRPWPISDEIWERSGQLVNKALIRTEGEYNLEDIRDHLESKDMQLWDIEVNGELKASVVTQILVFPQKKKLRGVALGGKDHKEWFDELTTFFSRFAKAFGCTSLELVGRPGWTKSLKRYGYRETYRILECEVRNE